MQLFCSAIYMFFVRMRQFSLILDIAVDILCFANSNLAQIKENLKSVNNRFWTSDII